MIGWHHRLNRHKFEQAPGDGEGQGSLANCSSWGRKKSDATEHLNKNQSSGWWKCSQGPLLLKCLYTSWLFLAALPCLLVAFKQVS